MDYQDPGWRNVLGVALIRATVIGLVWKRARLSHLPTILETIRSIFLGIAVSIWLILFVLSFVSPFDVPDSLLWWVLPVVGLGVVVGWVMRSVEGRLVRARNEQQLVSAYRSFFFVQLGLAEAVALVGFVLSFLAGSAWVYLVGAAMSSIDLWLMAPSRRNIVRIQERLNAAGVPVSLGAALTTQETP